MFKEFVSVTQLVGVEFGCELEQPDQSQSSKPPQGCLLKKHLATSL